MKKCWSPTALENLDDLGLEESCDLFEELLVPTTLEVVGPKKKRRHVWIFDEYLKLVEECRSARLNRSLVRYRTLRKMCRKNLRNDRRIWYEKIATIAESNFRKHNNKDLHKDIKEICEQHGHPSTPLLKAS